MQDLNDLYLLCALNASTLYYDQLSHMAFRFGCNILLSYSLILGKTLKNINKIKMEHTFIRFVRNTGPTKTGIISLNIRWSWRVSFTTLCIQAISFYLAQS